MDSADWDSRYAAAELLWSAGPNRFLVGELEGLLPGRALDLACGEGRNGLWLAEQGWQVTGVDFSLVAVERARRIAAERGLDAVFEQADVRAYEPPAAAFDLVMVFYLQLPAAERARALAAAARGISPGGTLLVVGHDVQNLNGGWGGPKDPGVLFTPDGVAGELPGLEVQKAERVLRPVETDEGEAQAIDALVRARKPS